MPIQVGKSGGQSILGTRANLLTSIGADTLLYFKGQVNDYISVANDVVNVASGVVANGATLVILPARAVKFIANKLIISVTNAGQFTITQGAITLFAGIFEVNKFAPLDFQPNGLLLPLPATDLIITNLSGANAGIFANVYGSDIFP